jgi:lysozyme
VGAENLPEAHLTLILIDLSSANTIGGDSYKLIRAAGVTGAWLKVSEGRTFNDRGFQLREPLAEYAGLRVGGYHYARPDNNTPHEEANHFLTLYRHHDDRRALKTALDMEAPEAYHLGRKLIDWAREWNRRVHAELGHWPLFYSYPDYITGAMKMTSGDKPVGGGLWIASYSRNNGVLHPVSVPKPWRNAVCHQFTSHGRMAGVAGYVDLNTAARIGPLLAHPLTGRI